MASKIPPPPSAMTSEDFRSPQWQAWFRQLGNTAGAVSVALSMPASTFTVTGSPVLNSGTLGVTLNSQTQGTFFAAPAVGAGTPTWRGIVSSDLPADLKSSNVLTWLSF